MHRPTKTYISAAGQDWLLPLYDPLTRLLGVEAAHTKLLSQAAISPGQRVLEIGCGTGNLTLLAQRLNPAAQFVGIDPDPKALARARRKAGREGFTIQFDPGFSQELPYPDASFDRVLSSLMLHHLPPDARLVTLQEAHRVLKQGGSLHLLDFDEASHPSAGLHGHIVHPRHGYTPHDMVIRLMREAGFAESQQVARQNLIIGKIVYYKALRSP